MARKKTKRRDDDDEDDDLDDEEAIVRRPKPKDDAWTGLLAIAGVCLIAATVLFYLDHAALTAQQVSAPNFTLPGLGGAAAPQG